MRSMRCEYPTAKGGRKVAGTFPGKVPATFRRCFGSLGGFTRVERQDVDAVRLDEFLELVGRPGQDRERSVVHRHDLANAEQTRCDSRAGRAHREMIADRK